MGKGMKASIQFSTKKSDSKFRGARYSVEEDERGVGNWLYRVARAAVEFYVKTHGTEPIDEINFAIAAAIAELDTLEIGRKESQ